MIQNTVKSQLTDGKTKSISRLTYSFRISFQISIEGNTAITETELAYAVMFADLHFFSGLAHYESTISLRVLTHKQIILTTSHGICVEVGGTFSIGQKVTFILNNFLY